MNSVCASAPGKIHLLGEHAAVYGVKAIVAAIDKRCKVMLTCLKEEKIHITKQEVSQASILEATRRARDQWKAYESTQNKRILMDIVKDPASFCEIAIGETLLHYRKQLPSGFSLSVSSDLPIGSGLGSSAAISSSIIAAISTYINEPFDKKVINAISFEVEKRKHGFPSGSDNTACCFGGVLTYRKKGGMVQIQSLEPTIPANIVSKFLLIDSGKPLESTGEMVHNVAAFLRDNEGERKKYLEDQEDLADKMLSSFSANDEHRVMEVLQKTEGNLERIGVVSKRTQNLIRYIEKSGGAAKICGAGGKKLGSGIVLSFHKNKDTIIEIADDFGMDTWEVKIGCEGVTIDEKN